MTENKYKKIMQEFSNLFLKKSKLKTKVNSKKLVSCKQTMQVEKLKAKKAIYEKKKADDLQLLKKYTTKQKINNHYTEGDDDEYDENYEDDNDE